MVDTTVATLVDNSLAQNDALWGPYWSDDDTGVIVYISDTEQIIFARTTDGGGSWAETALTFLGTQKTLSAWYDRETPSNTGTLIHLMWLDREGVDAARYRTVDVSDASLGTERVIDATITVSPIASLNRTGITVTRSGNIIAALSTQTEIACYRSVDGGASWDVIADVFETATEEDWILSYPANTDDDDDAAFPFWDRSASALSIKMWDNSAGTWTETAIASPMTASASFRNIDGAVRHSDSHVLLAAHSAFDTAGDDILTWDLTVDSIALPTVTAMANVVTDQPESFQIGMLINQQNGDVYVAYLQGGTVGSLVDCVYHLSIDGMDSWGAEQAYSEAVADDIRIIGSGRTVGNPGGRWQPSFANDDLEDIFVNLPNDVGIDPFMPPVTTGLPEYGQGRAAIVDPPVYGATIVRS